MTRVLPDDEVAEAAYKTAERIATGAPLTETGAIARVFLAHDAAHESETLHNVYVLVFRKQGDAYKLVGASQPLTLAADAAAKTHEYALDTPRPALGKAASCLWATDAEVRISVGSVRMISASVSQHCRPGATGSRLCFGLGLQSLWSAWRARGGGG